EAQMPGKDQDLPHAEPAPEGAEPGEPYPETAEATLEAMPEEPDTATARGEAPEHPESMDVAAEAPVQPELTPDGDDGEALDNGEAAENGEDVVESVGGADAL